MAERILRNPKGNRRPPDFLTASASDGAMIPKPHHLILRIHHNKDIFERDQRNELVYSHFNLTLTQRTEAVQLSKCIIIHVEHLIRVGDHFLLPPEFLDTVAVTFHRDGTDALYSLIILLGNPDLILHPVHILGEPELFQMFTVIRVVV